MSELADLMQSTFRRAVTYRVHGDRGQYRKPMIHRWPVAKIRGASTVADAIAENVTRGNPLFDRLVQRGRHR